eukprot:2455012-Prymnesium_polylepis.1
MAARMGCELKPQGCNAAAPRPATTSADASNSTWTQWQPKCVTASARVFGCGTRLLNAKYTCAIS